MANSWVGGRQLFNDGQFVGVEGMDRISKQMQYDYDGRKRVGTFIREPVVTR
jgi:hypothetical protein